MTVLSEFNNENLNTFRNRAYRKVTGAATDNDFHGTFPHTCLSHVMGSFRKIIKDHYKTNYDFGMYCFSTFFKLGNTYRFRGKIKGNLIRSVINSFRQKDIGVH